MPASGRATLLRVVPLTPGNQATRSAARTDPGATFTGTLVVNGLDQYAVGMKDPEGNEFDIN